MPLEFVPAAAIAYHPLTPSKKLEKWLEVLRPSNFCGHVLSRSQYLSCDCMCEAHNPHVRGHFCLTTDELVQLGALRPAPPDADVEPPASSDAKCWHVENPSAGSIHSSSSWQDVSIGFDVCFQIFARPGKSWGKASIKVNWSLFFQCEL